MLSHYCLVQVFRVKVYMQGTIRHAWIGEARYPFGRLGDRGYHPHVSHVIKDVHNLFLVLDRFLPLGMLERGDGLVSPDGIGPRHVAYGIKGVCEGLLQEKYVPDHCCRVRGSQCGQLHLEGWLWFGSGGQEMWVLRAGRGCSCVIWGVLC